MDLNISDDYIIGLVLVNYYSSAFYQAWRGTRKLLLK